MSESTILDRLSDERVFSIEKNEDGTFCIEEDCDNYFAVVLTPEELNRLGDEIKQLANNTQAHSSL